MSKPIVLVTGATGFIGTHLVSRLISMGWEVHVVLRARPERLPSDPIEGAAGAQVHMHTGSTSNLIEIVKECRPQIVFHLASMFLAQHQSDDIIGLVQSNVAFSTQLAEAMAVNNVRLLINAGTSWQHYQDADYSPVCLYAALKQAFEAVLQFYVETSALQVITLKLFDTYGPGDPRPKLLHLFKRIALSGETLAMSPGEQLIDLVYIDDVIDACLLAADRLQSGQVVGMESYAVSSGAALPLKDLAALYSVVSGYPLHIDWGGRPYRSREVMQPWLNFRVLQGWVPKIDLATGIRRCLTSE
jgi:nucleoside-diphosphate-sugar epimerase